MCRSNTISIDIDIQPKFIAMYRLLNHKLHGYKLFKWLNLNLLGDTSCIRTTYSRSCWHYVFTG